MHGEYVITVMYYYCVNKFHESVHTFIHHILNSPNTGSQKANKNRPQNDYILHTFTSHLYRCSANTESNYRQLPYFNLFVGFLFFSVVKDHLFLMNIRIKK